MILLCHRVTAVSSLLLVGSRMFEGVVFFDWHYMVKLYNVDEIHLMLEDQQCYKYASDTRQPRVDSFERYSFARAFSRIQCPVSKGAIYTYIYT